MNYHDYFEYLDGSLFWKLRPESAFSSSRSYSLHKTRYAGKKAGSLCQNGYLYVGIEKRLVLAHRVIWEMHNPPLLPGDEIDHRDTDRLNNRLENLRLASRHQNGCNTSLPSHNTSGFKGVSLHKRSGRFAAYYKKHGKKQHIGYFATAEEAHAAYSLAASREFEEFARP